MDRYLRLLFRPFHDFQFVIDMREEDIEQVVFVYIEDGMGHHMNEDIEGAFVGLDRNGNMEALGQVLDRLYPWIETEGTAEKGEISKDREIIIDIKDGWEEFGIVIAICIQANI